MLPLLGILNLLNFCVEDVVKLSGTWFFKHGLSSSVSKLFHSWYALFSSKWGRGLCDLIKEKKLQTMKGLLTCRGCQLLGGKTFLPTSRRINSDSLPPSPNNRAVEYQLDQKQTLFLKVKLVLLKKYFRVCTLFFLLQPSRNFTDVQKSRVTLQFFPKIDTVLFSIKQLPSAVLHGSPFLVHLTLKWTHHGYGLNLPPSHPDSNSYGEALTPNGIAAGGRALRELDEVMGRDRIQ